MIHLAENFYLDADDKQFILVEWDGSVSKVQNKDGSFSRQYKNQQYFSSFQSLLEKLSIIYIRRRIQKDETLVQLEKDMVTIKYMIEDIGKTVFPSLEMIRSIKD